MDGDDRFHRWLLGGVAVLMVVALWLRPLNSSLWLDEMGTWWVVKDGMREAIHRSFDIQGQSPLFYIWAWVARQPAGTQEWALRIPSVIFACASAFLLFRFARRLLDREYARIVVVTFIVWPAVSFSAADYRPYALATLALIASTMLLARWLDLDRLTTGIAYVLTVTALIYVHYLFALIVPVHACYALARTREHSTDVRLRAFGVAVAAVAILVTPLLAQIAALWGRRQEWTVQNPVTVAWVASAVLPTAFVVAGIVALAIRLASPRKPDSRIQLRRADAVLLVAWLVIPITLLCATDRVEDRYTLVSAPAAVLLVSLGFRWIEPASARRIIVLALAILSVIALGGAHHADDWRGALGTVDLGADGRSAVILQTGFQQADQLASFADPEERSFLASPASFYGVGGRLFLFPNDVGPATEEFEGRQVAMAMEGSDRIFLVTGSVGAETWLSEVLRPTGWVGTQLPTNGQPLVFEFTHG